jgi:hypothetical protein
MALNRYKSPGYYRVSLRDEVKTGFQLSKLQSLCGCRAIVDSEEEEPILVYEFNSDRHLRCFFHLPAKS